MPLEVRVCAYEAGSLNLVVESLGPAPGSVGVQTAHGRQGLVQALFSQPSRESPCMSPSVGPMSPEG